MNRDDAVIAMSIENSPILQPGPNFNFTYREHPLKDFLARFNSPLIPGPFTFASCVDLMRLHPTTASILDDIRFLITTVLNLSPQPSTQEVTKLQSTAMWIHDRIAKLPLTLPDASSSGKQSSSASDSAPASGSKARSPPVETPKRLDDEEQETKPHSLLPHYPSFTSSPNVSSQSSLGEYTVPSLVHDHASPGTKLAPPLPSEPPGRHPLPAAPSTKPSVPPQPRTREKAATETKTGPKGRAKSESEPDHLYAVVRLAAPLYARAIGTRRPFSTVCSPADALALLAATWRIPLSKWRGVIGVLLFTLVSIVATASGGRSKESVSRNGDGDGDGDEQAREFLKPHSGFVKSILQIGFMQMALESWEVCRETMERAGKLLAWLREEGVTEDNWTVTRPGGGVEGEVPLVTAGGLEEAEKES